MSSYNFDLTNGTPLIQIEPLEGNGIGNQSVPRQVLDVIFASTEFATPRDCFVVSGDVRTRFIQGMTFDVIGGTSYDGTYTVDAVGYNAGDQVGVLIGGRTLIPVGSISSTGEFDIVSATSGALGKFMIVGTSNGPAIFHPTKLFTVAGNSLSGANTTYQVQSTEQSGVYTLLSLTSSLNKFVVQGDYVRFFAAQTKIIISNLTGGLGEGEYRVSSVSLQSGNTQLIIDPGFNPIPVGASARSGSNVKRSVAAAIITVSGTVLSGVGSNGTITPSAPASLTLASKPDLTPTTPGLWNVGWAVTGDISAKLTVGMPILVKDAIYNGQRLTRQFVVISTTFVSPSGSFPSGYTRVLTAFDIASQTMPVVTIDSSSRFVFQVPPVPYGYIRYITDNAATTLRLLGKGAPSFNDTISWGNALQSNQIRALENFSSPNPPPAPLKGQLWFDSATPSLNLFYGDRYNVVGVTAGTAGNASWITDIPAASLTVGDKIVVYNNVGLQLVASKYTVTSKAQVTVPVTEARPAGLETTVGVAEAISSDALLTSAVPYAQYGGAYMLKDFKGIVGTTSAVQNAIDMNNYRIFNLANATAATDALNLQTADGRYVNVTGDTMTGVLNMSTSKITNIGDATAATDALNLQTADGRYVNVTGDTITGAVNFSNANLTLQGTSALTIEGSTVTVGTGSTKVVISNNKVTGLATPTAGADAVNKAYVDSYVSGIIWLSPILDPNLFDDSLSAPPAIDSPNTISYHKSYIVNGTGTGAWAGFNGHLMAHNGTSWISILGRPVQVGDRLGVFIGPDNDDLLASLPAGGLATHAGQLATVTAISPYTYSFYTPAEPDAVAVVGTTTGPSIFVGHAFTFRGTYGSGSYGTGYNWIEFIGPQTLVDGTGLKYTGNVLNVGAGTGITVSADAVALDISYTNALYTGANTTMRWLNTYSAGTAYSLNDTVTYLGVQYVCIQAGTGHTPSSSATYWQVSTPVFDGTVGSAGLVPPPGASDAANNKFLKADGTWAAVAITTSASANTVNAGPISGAAAAPTFRSLVTADLPLNSVTAWTKNNYVAQAILTDAATVAVDASLSNNFIVTLAGNRTLGNPTNVQAGMIINIVVVQDSTGSRTLAFDTMYKFPAGATPTLSSAANAVDMLSFYYDGTRCLANAMKGFA